MPSLEGIPDPSEVQHGDGTEDGGAQALEVKTARVLSIVSEPQSSKARLRDIVKCLRVIADDIEAGEHGDVVRSALVLRSAGMEPICFGHGDTSPSQSYMDLQAGAQQLMMMTRPERS